MTKNARAFMRANDASAVVSGASIGDGGQGGYYTLADGTQFTLALADCKALEKGYPKWDHGPAKRGPNNPTHGSVKTIAGHRATCRDCAKVATSNNALAWAHNHVKYTGHKVDLEMTYIVGPTTR